MENSLPSDNDRAFIDADLQYVSDLFLGERIRQKRDLGYTDDELKDSWGMGELGDAAAYYAMGLSTRYETQADQKVWPSIWGRPRPTPECRMRELVKAGGLLLHEAVRVYRSRFDDVPRVEPDNQNYDAWYAALKLAATRDGMPDNFLEQIDQASIGEEYVNGNDPVEAYKNLAYE